VRENEPRRDKGHEEGRGKREEGRGKDATKVASYNSLIRNPVTFKQTGFQIKLMRVWT
jgi:hypothetical protein